VLRRDGYCCKMCGVTRNEDVQIDTHHIKPRCRYPQGTYDVDNGISLCKSCHESIRGKESEFETQLLNAIKQ
jgi:predicted restriction endonuclease